MKIRIGDKVFNNSVVAYIYAKAIKKGYSCEINKRIVILDSFYYLDEKVEPLEVIVDIVVHTGSISYYFVVNKKSGISITLLKWFFKGYRTHILYVLGGIKNDIKSAIDNVLR